ncbi:MAG: SCO family protein [Opitutaceae bacterium]|nr:SCO family protein [Opitutaceae bacterium]
MKSHRLPPVAALAAFAVVVLAGCAKPDAAPAAAASAGKADRWPLTGEILKVDAARKVLVVHHDDIKGYMPAMTMEFFASAGDIAVAKPGQRIRAEMVEVKDSDFYHLEKIWPADPVAVTAIDVGANQLRQDTHSRGKNAYREVGETAPDFSLYDQTGRVVQAARFRGKQIMVNFIFTRCPIATMCPAATAKMMAVQRLARAAEVKNLELISITLDPAFDTPGVLHAYAEARGIDTANFSFLTGPETAIKDLLTQFGVIVEFEGPLIKHTLATLLIDGQGRIAHRTDGSMWEPQDFVAKMKRE